MLKEENAELLINGKRVESDYTFTADSDLFDKLESADYLHNIESKDLMNALKLCNPLY